jgi:glycosyltransferase involved in cell wall biosynthesis
VVAVAYQNFTPPVARAGRVTVLHDLIFLTRPEQFSRRERALLALIPRLLPRAEVVATVSEHIRALVLEQWPRRDPASVVVVPNGVADALFDAAPSAAPLAAAAAEHLGIRTPYALYLGRVTTRKNVARLLRAFARAGLDEHQLVIAGEPSGMTDDLPSLAATLGIAERLRMLGRVPQALLPGLLAGADLFCYVSLDEGFGVPPLEAMVYGVPAVVSDIPALRETAAPGSAVLVDPGDTDAIAEGLRRAATDAGVRERARTDGPHHASGYRWSHAADRLHAALERAAA